MVLDKEKLMTPGPLDYHPQPGTVKENHPSYSIPAARRPYEGNDVPPPGQYCPERAKSRDFKYSFTRETRETKVDPENGPGKYSPNHNSVLPVAPKQSIGKAERFEDEFAAEFEPGPGQYELNDEWEKSAPHYSFPRQSQRPSLCLNNNPGPGEYEFDDEFAENERKEKGWTLAGRNDTGKHDFDIIPGPSEYNPQIPQDKVMGGDIGRAEKHTEDKEKLQIPGPNLYQPYVDLVREHHPHFSFGTERRNPPRIDNGGCDAIYDVRKSPGGKSV